MNSIENNASLTVVTDSADRLLTPDQVAELLKVGRATLAHWRSSRQNSLKFVKVGRLIRYRQSDINAYIASRVAGG